ncbi:restriction endonuclease subunit S [Clostridium sp. AF37-5]|jgi:type I restriction enzyme S subunit|uniref:restriction endonuclease subunit S n=1 Tax=Clostridium sp. AF37-5 TaxID=2293016 RepID=UPI0015FAA2BD|nr:restriction endonuclease subunit S [Clostridium sp. AF37-5]
MKYKLKDIFDLQMGKTPSRDNVDYWNTNGYKWISIGDLSTTEMYISNTKEHLSEKAVQESRIKLIPRNTVVMSFKLSIGKTAITAEDMYSNEAIMAFHDKHVVDMLPKYIFYLFKYRDWDKGSNKAVMGKTLNKATLSEIEIELCSLEKQKEIVKVLDKIMGSLAGRKSELLLLDDLIKARFVEMFGDLANPECSWDKCKFVDACADKDDIKCGPFGTQLSKDEYTTSGIAVWEIPQINTAFLSEPTHFLTEEKAEQLNSYTIIPGDIAMSRKGNVGKCALFPNDYPDGIIHSDVLRIRVDRERLNPAFMVCQLHFSGFVTRQIELVSSGAIMAGVNVTKLKQIYVHVPPMDLQNQFADFVRQVDKSKLMFQKLHQKLNILRQKAGNI